MLLAIAIWGAGHEKALCYCDGAYPLWYVTEQNTDDFEVSCHQKTTIDCERGYLFFIYACDASLSDWAVTNKVGILNQSCCVNGLSCHLFEHSAVVVF